jgi:hypothetical protein
VTDFIGPPSDQAFANNLGPHSQNVAISLCVALPLQPYQRTAGHESEQEPASGDGPKIGEGSGNAAERATPGHHIRE